MNPYNFSPTNTCSLSNKLSSMNLNQSPSGPFAQRIPPNQNFNFNPAQNIFNQPRHPHPHYHQHPVNAYLPHQTAYHMEFDEPSGVGMVQNNFYKEEMGGGSFDVDKFLAADENGDSAKMPLPNYQMRMDQDNRENQYFLSNIGAANNSNNFYPY